jgi:hypothetical protein
MDRNGAEERDPPWLEAALLVAALALAFQLFPSLWASVVRAVDVRNWTHAMWFSGTIFTLLFLLGVRFGPDLWEEYRTQRRREAAAGEKTRQIEEARRRRKEIEQVKESRSRRIY